MNKIIYITTDETNLMNLGRSLGGKYAMERYSSEGSYSGDKGLIFIADWEPGERPNPILSDFLSSQHMYEHCPLFASIKSDRLIPACRLIPGELSGLITLPLEPTVLQTVIENRGEFTGKQPDSQFAAAIPFITGTTEVMQQTAGTVAECVAIFKSGVNSDSNFVNSSVTFAGAISGEAIVSMPTGLALVLASRITGLPQSELHQSDAADTVRELLNQITGKVKTTLTTLGGKVKCSLPSSDYNDNGTVETEPVRPSVQLLFQCDGFLYWLELKMAEQSVSLSIS